MPESQPQAVVAVLSRGGRYLVVRRGPRATRSGWWSPLSGRVEPGETQPQAVIREVQEELGMSAWPVAKVWECDTDDGVYRLHWWATRLGVGEPVPDPAEVSEVRWVLPEEYGKLHPTFADDRDFFTRILPNLEPAPGLAR